jgi:hypothetical protein
MTTPLPLGLAPYISPLTLQTAPTGIDWSTVGEMTADPSPAENVNEMWAMAARATSRVDGFCNQVLRATADVELVHGPDYRMTVGPASGGSWPTPYWGRTTAQNARIILSRWPVLAVTGVKTCPNGLWPRQWIAVPSGFFEPMVPPIGLYGSVAPGGSAEGGQAILVGGGFINWCYGRNGWAVEVSYLNGWPHCSLSAAALAGDTTISVNDCTGWALQDFYQTYTGATGRVVDSGQQEAIHVTASSVTAGPGTLTLSSALHYPHQPGTIVTTMPASVEQACILFAASEALTRGATSTTIHAVGGGAQSSDGGAKALAEEAELLIHPFRRTVLSPFVWFKEWLMASRRAQASCRRRGYRARTRNAAVIQQGAGGGGGDGGGKAQKAAKAVKARKG